jgi:hypothetical protein
MTIDSFLVLALAIIIAAAFLLGLAGEFIHWTRRH